MTDDNIIDISGELPPPDLHTRWRRRLPEYYLKHVDLLNLQYEQIEMMQKSLRAIHCELASKAGELEAEAEAHFADCKDKVGEPGGAHAHYADYSVKASEANQGKRAAQHIMEALVLLECAEEKLMHALPTEALMSREDIVRIEREFGGPSSPRAANAKAGPSHDGKGRHHDLAGPETCAIGDGASFYFRPGPG